MKNTKFIISIAYILCFISLTRNSSASPEDQHSVLEGKSILEKWENMNKELRDTMDSLVKSAIAILLKNKENVSQMNVSFECTKQSLHLFSGLRRLEPWALSFIDSSSKDIAGVMGGTLSFFGAYDECVDIKVPNRRNEKETIFQGQYCSIDFLPPLPSDDEMDEFNELTINLTRSQSILSEFAVLLSKHRVMAERSLVSFRLGICVPSGCRLEDIDSVAKTVGSLLLFDGSAARCEVKTKAQYSRLHIFVIVCFATAGFLVFTATMIDAYIRYKNKSLNHKCYNVLLAFSFVRSVEKLLNTKCESEALLCFSGMRFFTITWIILNNVLVYKSMRVLHNPLIMLDYYKNIPAQVLTSGSFALETFFFMGGFLVCYHTIKLVKEMNHKFNILLYVFRRLFRILPVYIFFMLFIFLMNIMGSGPLYEDTITIAGAFTDKCYSSWWTNLLFINNFFKVDNQCMMHTWYLAADFQLYLAALLVLLPLLRWPGVGITMSVIGITSSVLYSIVLTYIRKIPPSQTIEGYDYQLATNYFEYNFLPGFHMGAYFVGMLAGYLLATKPNMKIPLKYQLMGWTVAWISCLSIIYCPVRWQRGHHPSLMTSAMYQGFTRVTWALGIAWVTICCATGHASIVNRILSWKPFIPLSRLTFIAYLAHPIVQLLYAGSQRTHISTTRVTLVWVFFASLVATYMVAVGGSILIEAPFLSLEKLLFPRSNKVKNDKVEDAKQIPKDVEGAISNGSKNVNGVTEYELSQKF